MPFVRSDATTEICYRDAGSGQPLVLGHGFFMDSSMFDAQRDALVPPYRVLSWDARGHGRTRSHGPFDYWDAARDIGAVLDAAELDSAVIGGHSQGGFAALRFALLAPQRVSGLVLIDTEAAACSAADRAAYGELFAGWEARGPVDELTEPLARQIIGDEALSARWRALWRDRAGMSIRDAADCLLGRDDVTGRLAEITCPVLLIRGAGDVSISAASMGALRDGLPGAGEVHEIDGAAHTPNMTHPDQVNALLAPFLVNVFTPPRG